jgi:hypothetical protein
MSSRASRLGIMKRRLEIKIAEMQDGADAARLSNALAPVSNYSHHPQEKLIHGN